MQDTSVPVDRGRISVWYRPAIPGNPTVTLVHGLTGNSRWWLPVILSLPEGLGIIAPDLRGRGQSSEAPGPFGLDSLAPDISACLNHFEIQTTVLVGYSMGAWLTALYASTRTGRIGGVVLLDGGLPIDFDENEAPEVVLKKLIGPALDRFDRTYSSMDDYLEFWQSHPAFSGRWIPRLSTVFSYDAEELNGAVVSRANGKAIIDGGRDMLFDEQANKAVFELTVPTHVVVVDHDMLDRPGGFMSVAAATEARSRNPNVRVEMLTGLNHYTLLLGPGASSVANSIMTLL
ncbi:MAG: alpha/beta hydrolase [Acidimicrobiia bacterium]